MHYTPIKTDLSDLCEKFKWADRHPRMSQLSWPEVEAHLRGLRQCFKKFLKDRCARSWRHTIQWHCGGAMVVMTGGRPWHRWWGGWGRLCNVGGIIIMLVNGLWMMSSLQGCMIRIWTCRQDDVLCWINIHMLEWIYSFRKQLYCRITSNKFTPSLLHNECQDCILHSPQADIWVLLELWVWGACIPSCYRWIVSSIVVIIICFVLSNIHSYYFCGWLW